MIDVATAVLASRKGFDFEPIVGAALMAVLLVGQTYIHEYVHASGGKWVVLMY